MQQAPVAAPAIPSTITCCGAKTVISLRLPDLTDEQWFMYCYASCLFILATLNWFLSIQVNQSKEATMAIRSGMYSSNKRKKELMRQKKQEEKRLKRYKNVKSPSPGPEGADSINTPPESGADSSGTETSE